MLGAKILFATGNPALRTRMVDLLVSEGVCSVLTCTPDRALEVVGKQQFSLVIIDGAGATDDLMFSVVYRFARSEPCLPVILLNIHQTTMAQNAQLRPHVYDWFEPTANLSRLVITAKHAIEQYDLARELLSLKGKMLFGKKAPDSRPSRDEADCRFPGDAEDGVLIGTSRAMEEVRKQIAEVAASDVTVLLEGESGTGKDVAARLIHATSPQRKNGNLVKVNCPAVPELLLESELFGHEAGAFTGALKAKPGRLELARNGTAFLDEIGQISKSAQAKLLQVLEHRQFTRLGGTDTITVNTRIIAATNTPLQHLIVSGEFRPDLYFRLNQYKIELPPLRQRSEDIPALVAHFLVKYAPRYGNRALTVSDAAMSALERYRWPGNVRELEAAVRRLALTGREETLTSEMSAGFEKMSTSDNASIETCEANERRLILAALTQSRWNRREAAKILGISYNTLRRRIMTYGFITTG
ncbi:MAG: sigma-54-dependent Fis family transcriptional regulator [Candidatus Hydrogenedentes bacterium]|nr:sigma-54-dependent Fis family transcriptional regulator [Candidatus Hydrogenedentota bacterium]